MTGRERNHPVDPIPAWRSWRRKLTAFRCVSKNRWRVASQEDFIETIRNVQAEACRSDSVAEMTLALWHMEKLGFSLAAGRLAGTTLHDERIPPEVQPIAHAGMGIAAIWLHGLQPAAVADFIDRFAHPGFQAAAYESIGAGLGVYTQRLFKFIFQLTAGMPFPSVGTPRPAAFLEAFLEALHRLISHGYGRALYFQSPGIGRALRAAQNTGFADAASTVHGAAFAYAMVNHAQLPAVMDVALQLEDTGLAAAYREGILYCLGFWEWAFPGFLRLLPSPTPHRADLIAEAQRRTDAGRGQYALVVPPMLTPG